MARTSPSSPGSEDLTLPLSGSGSDVSGKSRSTSTAPLFSNDIGPESRDGETLLASPMAGTNRKSAKAMARSVNNGRRSGGGNSSSPGLEQQIETLLPTPTAQAAKHAAPTEFETRPRDAWNPWTLFAGVFPASQSQPPEGARPKTTTGGSGPSSPVSFASLDPDGSWLKTSPDSSVQATLLGPLLVRFSGTWPRSGSMHAGTVFAHPMLERPTAGSGSSYLHTPSLNQTVRMLPTPTADHSRGLAQPGTDYQSLPNAVLSLGDLTNPQSEGGQP